ncbi:hypothetical protein COK19_09185 [Bacillus cereus]|nr:hypothetical protein COK19_09185 [Bacillus cereus]
MGEFLHVIYDLYIRWKLLRGFFVIHLSYSNIIAFTSHPPFITAFFPEEFTEKPPILRNSNVCIS